MLGEKATIRKLKGINNIAWKSDDATFSQATDLPMRKTIRVENSRRGEVARIDDPRRKLSQASVKCLIEAWPPTSFADLGRSDSQGIVMNTKKFKEIEIGKRRISCYCMFDIWD